MGPDGPWARWVLNAGYWSRTPQPAGLCGQDRIDAPLDWPGARREHRAHHEAGHAVAALAAGVPVTRIRLAPGDDQVAGLGGGTELHLPQDWELASPILAAGEVAAQRWLLHTGRWNDAAAWAVEMSAADDRRRLADAAERADLPYVEYRGDWDRACTEARRLLAPQWFAVDALALQLLHQPERAIDELADVFVIR